MFQVKICGVTRPQDVQAVVDGGADAIGLNFVASSPRHVSLVVASELSELAERRLFRVGVVKNPTASELDAILKSVPLDAIQLHGQETPEILKYCGGLPVIKAVSWSAQNWEEDMVLRWRQSAENLLLGFLVDAPVPGTCGEIGGGSGKTAKWELLFPRPTAFGSLPIILAGGLRPSNIGQAIGASRCYAVDTASGVETSPGVRY